MVGVLTIGYGCTKNVHEGQNITQDQADQMLLNELAEWENLAQLHYPYLNDNQFAALVSLLYNVGSNPIHGHLGMYLSEKNYPEAADQFRAWCYAGGRKVEGLVQRRESERTLFLRPDSV
jgi:lysozyme